MTLCPKCNYKRNVNDYAPEYECPNCGIVYEKYKGEAKKDFNKNRSNDQQSLHNEKNFIVFILKRLRFFVTATSFLKNFIKKGINYFYVDIKTVKKRIPSKKVFYIAGACFISIIILYNIILSKPVLEILYKEQIKSCHNSVYSQANYSADIVSTELDKVSIGSYLKISGKTKLQNGFGAWTQYEYCCYSSLGESDNHAFLSKGW